MHSAYETTATPVLSGANNASLSSGTNFYFGVGEIYMRRAILACPSVARLPASYFRCLLANILVMYLHDLRKVVKHTRNIPEYYYNVRP